MKIELRVLLIRKPDYASFGYVTIPKQSLVTSNLRHLDVVSAKNRVKQGLLQKQRPQVGVQGNKLRVHLMKHLFNNRLLIIV